MPHIRSSLLASGWRPSRRLAGLYAGLTALVGVVVVVALFAAGTFAAFEPENGTLSSGATVVNVSGASGGKAVQFGAGTTSPTPTPTPTPTPGGAVCPAFPAFPDASCTGWAHTGVTLKAVPGQMSSGTGWNWEGSPFNYVKITSSNAVLDGLDMGCVYVDVGVTNATIKRSRIRCGGPYMVRLDNSAGSVTMTDVELDGQGVGAVGIKGASLTLLRLDVHGFTGKGVMLGSGTSLEDSYIHDNTCNPPDHQSAIGTNGGASNMVMRHNNVDLSPSECTSGGISNYDDFGAFHDLLIEKNLVNSAGYCLKTGFEDNNAAGNSGEQVIGNVFGRKYYPECGSFGVQSSWMPGVAGNVWSGNTWGGGAAATGAHAVGDPVSP